MIGFYILIAVLILGVVASIYISIRWPQERYTLPVPPPRRRFVAIDPAGPNGEYTARVIVEQNGDVIRIVKIERGEG